MTTHRLPRALKSKPLALGSHLIAPFVTVLVIAILIMGGSIYVVAMRADRLAEARQSQLVASAAEGKISAYIDQQRGAMSELAPNRVEVALPHGYMLTFDDRGVLRADRRGALAPESTGAALASLAASPIAALRRDLSLDGGPASVTQLMWLNGRPILAIATPALSPQGGTMVGITDLGELLPEFGTRLHLENIRFGRPSASDSAAARLTAIRIDGARADLGLDWTREPLGLEIILGVLPGIMAVTGLFLVGGGWLVHRAQKLARSLIASETHAKHLALHDSLTGLANRALFTDRLDHALERRRRNGGAAGGGVAVVCIDLDRFKRVNDTLGHQAGDAMIREAARRIAATCRPTDTVARLGGDEFALVLSPVDDHGEVVAICDRLSETLTSILNLPDGQAVLSASLGAVLVEDDRSDGADLIRQSDLALYRAKADGRGCYAIFRPEMDASQRLRRVVENELRDVIEAGGLDVAYQPQFTARGVIEGVEALVRWTHPTRGPMSPAQFIPIAEEAGLIEQLGDFVMHRALTDAARWPSIRIAINVSPIQLRRPSFVGRTLQMAKCAGVDPRRVELEITEGVMIDSDPHIQETLRGLRGVGFRLALDDFGTGYSSLSYLSAYPVDKIKIDRSFVSNLTLGGDGDKVVRAIIHLGRALGLSVTAEGVETEAQRMMLVAAGCNSLQGFLHGRPAEASVIDRMVLGGVAMQVA